MAANCARTFVRSIRSMTGSNLVRHASSARSIHTCVCNAAATKPKKPKKRIDATKLLEKPVDDVYLLDLYEPVVYQLGEAVATLKRCMELDFANPDSKVVLDIDLHLAPKGKGKHQTFWHIEEPIHKFTHTNRVCVFTEDAEAIKICNENGAYFAGGHDIIQRIIFGNEVCDAYVTTQELKKTLLDKHVELTKIMGKLAPKRNRGLNPDVVAELLRLREGMLIHNQHTENHKCSVVVGLAAQPADHIVDNIIQVIDVVRSEQNPKHPPIVKGAAVRCCEESLIFDIGNEED